MTMAGYDKAVDRYVEHLNTCGRCKGREVEAMCPTGRALLRTAQEKEGATP